MKCFYLVPGKAAYSSSSKAVLDPDLIQPILDHFHALGFTPDFPSGIPLKFWKISSGDSHPVDQRFQLNALFEATEWEQSGVYFKDIKYKKIPDPVSPGT